jgi:hypothetical protein
MICESKSLKGKTFAQISPLLIEKYKKERRESELENGRTRKPSTINRELQILSRIFSLAIRYRVTDKNPCSEVSLLPENNKRARYLFDEEERRLLSVLTGPRGHLLPLVVLAIGTGMRRGDPVQSNVGEGRFPTRIDLRPKLEDGKRLFGADERRRQSHAEADTKHHSRRRLRFHQSRYRQALYRSKDSVREGLSVSGD